MPRIRVPVGCGLAVAATLLLAGSPLAAQSTCWSRGSTVQMQTLLEKSIFKVDVLWLTLQLSGPTAERLQAIVADRTLSDQVADSVASIAVDAECAVAQIDFIRNISRERFLDGLRDSARQAWTTGFLDEETYRYIESASVDWYPFLRERGVLDGDRMTYRVRGDTLDIEYTDPDGGLLMDDTEVGVGRSRSVLAGYFAPGSDFRDGLMEALFREDDAPAEGQTPELPAGG